MKFEVWHWGTGPIIVYSNDDPGSTMTCFTTRSNFAIIMALIQENVTMMDFLELIAASDLEIG